MPFYFSNLILQFAKYKKNHVRDMIFTDSPYGIRTRDTAVKRRCLNPLTNGPG